MLLYACWEGVGLCSYLLIGFWFAKPSAAAAARKAFLVTRLGDIGLFIGILILWHNSPAHSLEYDDDLRQLPATIGSQRRAVLGVRVPVHRRGRASRRSSRCTSGCPTRWKARRRSAP